MKRALALMVLLALVGCQSAGNQAGMTLKDAMSSTVDAISTAQAKAMKSGITGFMPCDLTASFNVTSTTGGSLGVAIAPPHSPLGLTGKVDHDSSLGNTVTVDYKSQACIDMTAHEAPKPAVK